MAMLAMVRCIDGVVVQEFGTEVHGRASFTTTTVHRGKKFTVVNLC